MYKSFYAWWCLLFLMLGIIAFGHNQIKIVQVFILALPFLLLLYVPLSKRTYQRARTIIVIVVLGSFVIDSSIRSFIAQLYQAEPNSSMVISAVANTTQKEMTEFFSSYGRTLMLLLVTAILVLSILIFLVHACYQNNGKSYPLRIQSLWIKGFVVVVLILCAAGYAIKPWRKLHPIIFWTEWVLTTAELKSSWHDLQNKRAEELNFAKGLTFQRLNQQASTIVLVISESLNRDNMSTHGYSRETTPNIQKIINQNQNSLINFPYAWSVKANTFESLNSLFYLKTSTDQSVNFLALAKAAGYYITWISNHDDQAIEQKYARFAQHVELLNKVPGRESFSSDSAAQTPLVNALAMPYRYKLIVVHLLGVHPRYGARYPKSADIFKNSNDLVAQSMENQDRPGWLIDRRNEYDAAIHNHDEQIAKIFQASKESIKEPQRGAWVFVSDHGQEVGHSLSYNHAGHSASTAAGYRIPALIWSNQGFLHLTELRKRPFRLDWLGWTMLSLMDIQLKDKRHTQDILSDQYQFVEPDLGILVPTFHN